MGSDVLRIAARTVSNVFVAFIVVLAVVLVGVRLIGFDVYVVLSGSMEPTYQTGSVIWVQKCGADDVEVGDSITFHLNGHQQAATHRVVEKNVEEGYFVTKGDANEAADGSPTRFEDLIGKPVFSVPGLGYFVSFIQRPPGIYFAIAAGVLVVALIIVADMLGKAEEPDKQG